MNLPINQSETAINLNKVDEAYSSEPWWYDVRGFLILTFAYRTTIPNQIRLFSHNMRNKHLEIAIGTGTLLKIILDWRRLTNKSGLEILGFDYAERMLNGARKRFAKERNISLLRADAASLPIKDNTFDSASIANAIHCLPDIKGGLKETFRVLKPGGTLVGNCLLEPRGNGLLDQLAKKINKWGIKKGILYRTYDKEEVTELLQNAGFKINFSEVRGNCFNFVAEK